MDYDQSPVFPWEYFFLWLRAVDLQAGKSLPVWVLPPLTDDVTDSQVRYAEVRLLPGRMRVRGNECLHIEVITKDGPKGEFWILAGGLHHVVEGRLPDGTTFSLERIDRKRFWDF